MDSAHHTRAPAWKWDNTRGIWYWWDAKHGVKRGVEGNVVGNLATSGQYPPITHSRSPSFTGAGTSSSGISGWSESSVVSNHLLQRRTRPTNGFGPSRRITTHDWKVAAEPLKYFLPGQVFSVRRLSAVPLGRTPREAAGTRSTQGIQGLVVVKAGILSCSVVPIVEQLATGDIEGYYEAQQHGIVYTGNVVPTISEVEAEMQSIPIQIEPEYSWYTLRPTARVHYGKVHNIEHSEKVLPFGRISEADKESFLMQFARVWSAQLGVSLGIADPTVKLAMDSTASNTALDTRAVHEQSPAPLADNKCTSNDEVYVPDAVDNQAIELQAIKPTTSLIPESRSHIRATTLPTRGHIPLTTKHSPTPSVSHPTIFETSIAAPGTGMQGPALAAPEKQSERDFDQPDAIGNVDSTQSKADVDRLYGRLKRFVGLHDSALEQQSVAIQKRHNFERELDAAWESLAQCLQVMDNAVRRRADGLGAAHEELDEAFRKARDRVGSARTVQKQSAAKRQELSTAESNIRDNTKAIKDLLKWRVAREEILGKMDEMKADIARNSENASAKEVDETEARQRPEVVAFDQARERADMTRMQLQELEEEHEEQRRHQEIALDRSELSDLKFAGREQDYEVRKVDLIAALDRDELDLRARERECRAAGYVFLDEALPSNTDMLERMRHKTSSLNLRDEDRDLDELPELKPDTLSYVDHWLRQMPPNFTTEIN